jgi:hypothetical protein
VFLHSDKYRDLPKAQPFVRTMLDDHARGVRTYAATLDANDRALRLRLIWGSPCGPSLGVLSGVAYIAALLRQVAAATGQGDDYEEIWSSERNRVSHLPFGLQDPEAEAGWSRLYDLECRFTEARSFEACPIEACGRGNRKSSRRALV